jgi:signal transduction histidine kinase
MSGMATTLRPPSLHRSLSARLLVLTIAFVLLGEVLIYVPSISRFRKVYLEERIAAGHLATLSLEAAGESGVSTDLEAELLAHAGVLSVTLRAPEARLMLGELPPVDAVFELGEAGPPTLILHAFDALLHGGDRTIRVMGASPQAPAVLVDISLQERPLWTAMVDYSWRILNLSIVLSLMVAFLVYCSLQILIVRPLRRVTESVVAFRHRPEDFDSQVPPAERGDEIGVVQNELGRMQHNLRTALAQKTRLAALGSAVTKINHDLRNILANAIILSDRLEQSQDPDVRHVAPRIVDSMDRAARLCSETLTFSRAQAVLPQKTSFALAPLIEEVGAATMAAERGDAEPGPVRFRNEVRADLLIRADRDQLFRVLLNLARNAREALPEHGGLISITAWEEQGRTLLEVADTGIGMPASVREHLFEPFSGSTRAGGSGLGLAIAREIMAAHGGDIELVQTGADGTLFRLTLPTR